ncbi:MAG: trehalose operon repressor [Peptoniphilaceae bacterium]|nr:trehalose operon repressor [Peptoniphilaceae bacterium]MDD7383243.1 trehalose operon repressor [Peptoniphilaceae bacterium]MDY3737611.1 trehalose operon repressor [Peptoniphilaceae bacterium]
MTKYELIYKDILQMIKNEEIKPGEKILSEKDLMNKYNASRHTVRKALTILENHGFIQKNQGKNATVISRNMLNFPISEIRSFTEINELENLSAQTIVEDLEIINDESLVKKLFGIEKEKELIKLVRVRKINNESVILDIDYFRRKIVSNIPLKEARKSVYNYLENNLSLNIGYAVKQFFCESPSENEKKLLDLKTYDTVVVVSSNTYLSDNTIFQYTKSIHRPDKFKFVEIARRIK